MKMGRITFRSFFLATILFWSLNFDVICGGGYQSYGPLVTKESRRTIVSSEYGEITAVDLHDGFRGPYHLQFFTMDTSTLLLPLLLHTDMVFYVLTGKGSVSWIGEDGIDSIEVKAGDIYRLVGGTVFYVRSYPDATRVKLRIHAIFDTVGNEYPSMMSSAGVYSNVSDLVRGFDDVILQMGFGVSQEVIQEIKGAEQPPPIVPFKPNNTEIKEANWKEDGIFEALFGGSRHKISLDNGKKKEKKKKKEKTTTFNVFESKPDVENCNGKSIEVTSRKLKSLRGSEIGMFMVNLTKGSMMGPHWNPMATEIAVVVHGQGMVQVVCPVNPSGLENDASKCENTTIKVEVGDVFIVQQYHPMVQISFNNDSFVFMGFSTMATKNHPQFLAGKLSVLQTIDREILATSFNVANMTINKFLDSQIESVMFECTSCAEELERKMQEEIERKRQEEKTRKREEEETRRREEEERKREEEEAKRREEEERKKEEEEARKREEEEKRRKQEERRREEEAAARRREGEEEEKRRQEEEARKEEEEKARKREEEEEARRREEEEARRREEEEARREKEEKARGREEEEEEAKRREEEAKRIEEEEEARREEEEEARRREKEEARQREEEEAKRREEEARTIEEEEEARRRGEEEERQREEEEIRRREAEEEEARRREEEEARKREEEEEEERGRSVKGVERETSKKVRMIWRV